MESRITCSEIGTSLYKTLEVAMTTYAKRNSAVNQRKQNVISKHPRFKRPSLDAIAFVCAGLLNLIYMLIFLPAGLRTIAAYPLNLGVLVFVNASVMFILWIDNRRFSRSITYGFIFPFIFVVLT